jgi:hypothetical protein
VQVAGEEIGVVIFCHMLGTMFRVFLLLTCVAAFASAGCVDSATAASRSYYDINAFNRANALCTAGSAADVTITFGKALTFPAVYAACIANPSGGLCVDECVVRTSCMSSSICTLVPGRSTALNCVSKDKLCSAFSGSNASLCQSMPMCGFDSSSKACYFAPPSNPTTPPGESVAEKCPALHPIVIAMLVLMFLTFIAGVVIVAVVVIRNQKKADEEEQRKEQAAAAAAEAKRARVARNQQQRL